MVKYREIIDIIELVETSDGAGGFTSQKVVRLNTFAHVAPKSFRSTTEAGGVNFLNGYAVTIRQVDGYIPNSGDLVKWNGREFTIQSATPSDTQTRELKLMCFDLNRQG